MGLRNLWCPRCHQRTRLKVVSGVVLTHCLNKTCKMPSLQLGSRAFTALVERKCGRNPPEKDLHVPQRKVEVSL